jgi:hypothetical protein
MLATLARLANIELLDYEKNIQVGVAIMSIKVLCYIRETE